MAAKEESGDPVQRAMDLILAESEESDRAAFELLHPLALAENARAQVLLGWLREVGRGCEQSDLLAEQLYRASADQQYAAAQFYLGWMYQERGEHDLATSQFARAAGQSFLPALYRLALFELKRDSTSDKAVALLRTAASKGHLPSAIRLAGIMARGKYGLLSKARALVETPFLMLRYALRAARTPSDESVLR